MPPLPEQEPAFVGEVRSHGLSVKSTERRRAYLRCANMCASMEEVGGKEGVMASWLKWRFLNWLKRDLRKKRNKEYL